MDIDLFDGLFDTLDPERRTKHKENGWINKPYTSEHELNIVNENVVLPINKSFGFKNIHILNGILSLDNHGILDLQSLNDIILENAEINLKGQKHHRSYKNVKTTQNTGIYGRNIDQIFMGKRGFDFGEGSGGGGGGLRLLCKNKLILKNSTINISGSPCCEHNHQPLRCGGPGEDGSCLIICNQLIMDNKSRIYRGRVVVQLNNTLAKEQIQHLCYGYLRHMLDVNVAIVDIFDLCISYYPDDIAICKNYNISRKPRLMDAEWNGGLNVLNMSDANQVIDTVNTDDDDGFRHDFTDPFEADSDYNKWKKRPRKVADIMGLYKDNKQQNEIDGNVNVQKQPDIFTSLFG